MTRRTARRTAQADRVAARERHRAGVRAGAGRAAGRALARVRLPRVGQAPPRGQPADVRHRRHQRRHRRARARAAARRRAAVRGRRRRCWRRWRPTSSSRRPTARSARSAPATWRTAGRRSWNGGRWSRSKPGRSTGSSTVFRTSRACSARPTRAARWSPASGRGSRRWPSGRGRCPGRARRSRAWNGSIRCSRWATGDRSWSRSRGASARWASAGAHSTTLPWQALRDADPDVIVVAPCGFGVERTLAEMPTLAGQPGWGDLAAVRAGRVYVADGNLYFNRSGPLLFDTPDILAEILHPAAFPPAHEGAVWRRWPSRLTAQDSRSRLRERLSGEDGRTRAPSGRRRASAAAGVALHARVAAALDRRGERPARGSRAAPRLAAIGWASCASQNR